MERRHFVKIAGGGALGLALPGVIPGLSGAPPPGPAGRTDLAIAHGSSPAAVTKAAIDALGGIRKFISRGDIVVVKPNIGWDGTPEMACNTNPEVVAALVRLCLEAGAKTVKVFDRPVNDARRTYLQSGIEAAARAAGAQVSYINDRKFREVAIKGDVLKTWPLYTEVLEADKLINVPIAKHHGLSRLALSLKNWMGVMGSSRGRIHQRIDESLADLALVLKPALTVLDAVRILTANGPRGGDLRDVKKLDTVIAGIDQVAVDSYGATLFGLRGSDVGSTAAASRRGLGVMDLGKLSIRKVEV